MVDHDQSTSACVVLFVLVFVVFCLDISDVVGRKVCSSHDAGYKIIATTPALSISSAREPDQGKTKPVERPK